MVINNMGEAGRCYLHPIEHPASVNLPIRCNMHWTDMQDPPHLVRHLGPGWITPSQAARHWDRLLDLLYWDMKTGGCVAWGILQLGMATTNFWLPV
jgi:hypothetical protein